MPADWYPGAVRREVTFETRPFPSPPLGWILHVVVGNNSPYRLWTNVGRNAKVASWWVSKSGVVEQYLPASRIPWAQVAGNQSYWAVETEGFPQEPLTDAQLDALAALHVWLGVADRVATAPGQRGIGTHSMGGAAWGGHECPGPVRAGQIPEILRRAAALRAGGDMPTAAEVADAIALRPMNGTPNSLQEELDRTYQAVMAMRGDVATLKADVAALKALLPPAPSAS